MSAPPPVGAASAARSLDLETLEREVSEGSIDTVVCVTPDLWGRLVGKRLTGASFLHTALGTEGIHGSLYLFVVDMDMDPREGYALANWENGFPDFRFVPDLATLRRVPWMEATAIVLCDAADDETGELVEIAPRTILRRQIAALEQANLAAKAASELEFYLCRGTYRDGWRSGYRDVEGTSYYRGDYHLLQSTKDEGIIRQIRNQMNDADIEVEFSKSEWGLGQQEINLRYTDTLEMADRHILYKHGVKEIAALSDLSATFMAKPFIEDIGSSCHVHASLWRSDRAETAMVDEARPHRMSQTFRHALGGLLATTRELALLSASNVNSYKRYVPSSFAPTAITWGLDNRTCGYRVVGHGSSLRLENRIPGADTNPYLSFTAMILGMLHGLRNAVDCGDPYRGNAYVDPGLARVPMSLHESIDEFGSSAVAREALGNQVFGHLLNFARQEQLAFDNETVTDWERVRYFERI